MPETQSSPKRQLAQKISLGLSRSVISYPDRQISSSKKLQQTKCHSTKQNPRASAPSATRPTHGTPHGVPYGLKSQRLPPHHMFSTRLLLPSRWRTPAKSMPWLTNKPPKKRLLLPEEMLRCWKDHLKALSEQKYEQKIYRCHLQAASDQDRYHPDIISLHKNIQNKNRKGDE